MPGKRPNLYAMLGILRSATSEEIRRAYLKAAKKLHPDKNTTPGETELFLGVQEAYQILSDAQRRAAYDATLGPDEEVKSPIQLEILLSRKTLQKIDEPQLIYAMFNIQIEDTFRKQFGNPILNLCLVVDCSTSMKGEKLDTVKRTAAQLIRQLRPQDIFSVVNFSDKAEVLIPATRQLDTRRAEIKIQMLQTSGGTEILHGLETGYQEVLQYANPNYVNHIILLTDGRTYGDEENCYELAKQAAKDHIGISGLGIGHEWNDVFLDHLTQLTGGHSMFVSQPQDIERLLNDKLQKLTSVFAESVTFNHFKGENVTFTNLFRVQPESAPLLDESEIKFGPLLRDESLSILIEMRVQLEKSQKKMTLVKGALDITAASVPVPIPAPKVEITLPVAAEATMDPPPTAIVQAVSKLTLYRMQEKARQDLLEGNYNKATEHLQALATRLLSQGERGLARTVLLEVENIEKEKAFTDGGDKRIKYGTRSLLMPGEKKP